MSLFFQIQFKGLLYFKFCNCEKKIANHNKRAYGNLNINAVNDDFLLELSNYIACIPLFIVLCLFRKSCYTIVLTMKGIEIGLNTNCISVKE